MQVIHTKPVFDVAITIVGFVEAMPIQSDRVILTAGLAVAAP
jgi:hypothetical protein